jgi:hypothetical protein
MPTTSGLRELGRRKEGRHPQPGLRFCNHGHGCRLKPRGDTNGRWHEPFATLGIAHAAATATKRPVRPHRCI